MGTILVMQVAKSMSGKEKKVVPFVVGNSENLASIRNTVQVKFMVDQGWLKKENVLFWEQIKKIGRHRSIVTS